MKLISKFFTLLVLITLSAGFVSSCDEDNDEDYPTLTVTNASTYTLPRFRVVFVNDDLETLSDIDYGTLYPNESVSNIIIPAGASKYYMATYLSGEWFFSPYYSTSIRKLKLDNSTVGQWS